MHSSDPKYVETSTMRLLKTGNLSTTLPLPPISTSSDVVGGQPAAQEWPSCTTNDSQSTFYEVVPTQMASYQSSGPTWKTAGPSGRPLPSQSFHGSAATPSNVSVAFSTSSEDQLQALQIVMTKIQQEWFTSGQLDGRIAAMEKNCWHEWVSSRNLEDRVRKLEDRMQRMKGVPRTEPLGEAPRAEIRPRSQDENQ